MAAAADEQVVLPAGATAQPCAALRPLWSAFCDAFAGTLHAGGAAAQPRPPPPPSPSRLPAVPRLLAFGDLHGDYDKTVAALRLSGLVDERLRWAAPAGTWAVQVGDILDRGGSEVRIFFLLERLEREAAAAGGRFVLLNGNHESMNMDSAARSGRFRYATAAGLAEFDSWRRNQRLCARLKGLCGEPAGACSPGDAAAVPPGTAESCVARAAALCAGCPLARRFLAERPHAVQVGSSVFVHGGLLEEHAAQGLESVNAQGREWLTSPPGTPLPELLGSRRAVVWARHYSLPEEAACDCGELARALALTPGAERVVVGHTIQGERGINAACGGAAVRVDVGMSAGCGGHPPAALEIVDDGRGGVYRLTADAEGRTKRETVVPPSAPSAPATPTRAAG